jgi:hypothetical protein
MINKKSRLSQSCEKLEKLILKSLVPNICDPIRQNQPSDIETQSGELVLDAVDKSYAGNSILLIASQCLEVGFVGSGHTY